MHYNRIELKLYSHMKYKRSNFYFILTHPLPLQMKVIWKFCIWPKNWLEKIFRVFRKNQIVICFAEAEDFCFYVKMGNLDVMQVSGCLKCIFLWPSRFDTWLCWLVCLRNSFCSTKPNAMEAAFAITDWSWIDLLKPVSCFGTWNMFSFVCDNAFAINFECLTFSSVASFLDFHINSKTAIKHASPIPAKSTTKTPPTFAKLNSFASFARFSSFYKNKKKNNTLYEYISNFWFLAYTKFIARTWYWLCVLLILLHVSLFITRISIYNIQHHD